MTSKDSNLAKRVAAIELSLKLALLEIDKIKKEYNEEFGNSRTQTKKKTLSDRQKAVISRRIIKSHLPGK